MGKRYGDGTAAVTALTGIDLEIGAGERLVVQGPPGGGKTTLLRLLGGLERPTEGRVLLDGVDLGSLGDRALTRLRARRIGFVPRRPVLVATLTVQQNVEAALVPLGLKGAHRRRTAAEVLDAVGLADLRSAPPGRLDPEQRQRAALARALAKDPAVLLADDPTGDLPAPDRAPVMSHLHHAWRDRGLTLVLVTHDTAVTSSARRVGTLRGGRLALDARRTATR
ncbi:ABC transporter ATP-binding protein [Streptantibioticus cattleyicolor NRRL 8057 = DSM 46488]|uniref:ABC transporter ATP-binding protein n=1 Tax=Streptantibioticus cattleyicolor (strain ATCC 35852 / DSM 46488 / JCM 4925 / NBRC 14057 / NRRL 8057) TaxID=1003195 RepID=G8WR34_STREN|nr:ABC transporter ATP-binding protein [Streptantibioticus cattleyicolor NRRL 8057 = DSM 46488]